MKFAQKEFALIVCMPNPNKTYQTWVQKEKKNIFQDEEKKKLIRFRALNMNYLALYEKKNIDYDKFVCFR